MLFSNRLKTYGRLSTDLACLSDARLSDLVNHATPLHSGIGGGNRMKLFEDAVLTLYQDEGKVWLMELPRIVEALTIHWGLSDLKPVDNMSYAYVLSGLRGAQPIILKLSIDRNVLKQEALALRNFEGFGAVKVLEEQDGALLLECAISGASLKSHFPLKDHEAVIIVSEMIKKLHKAPLLTDDFPHINDWLKTLDKKWDIPASYLEKARKLRDYLHQTSGEPVMLHGDLHHDNILQNDTGWVVIDPKGVRGERTYEPAAFIRNPIPELLALEDVRGVITKRLADFANLLALDASRLQAWCFVQAVLAWAWALEDDMPIAPYKALTEIFDSMDS